VAEALDLPCASVVVKLDLQDNSAVAEREIEGGKEKLSFQLPAVISCQKGLNEPRYRSLKGIMAAKKITIEEIPATLESEKVVVEKLSYPPQKPPGRIIGKGVEAVTELVKLLREEAKVI
jgi:electron transfer flavoprotein beta subunit